MTACFPARVAERSEPCWRSLPAWLVNKAGDLRLCLTPETGEAIRFIRAVAGHGGLKKNYRRAKSGLDPLGLMESICPRASSDLLDALADCLAYEADAVADVFPGVEPLWLEEGTPEPTDNVYEVWVATYKRYKSWVDSKQRSFPAESAEALTLLSAAAWEAFDRKRPQIEVPDWRDEKFARLVLEKIKQVSGGWAIVIVGVNHARNNEGRMRYRLAAAAIKCKVDFIKPNGPVPA